ncbi:LOW QUALITY PROTEIN: DNA-binding helix-turn-helix protein, partial [Erysipelotrichaceae bacterium 3_1_53]
LREKRIAYGISQGRLAVASGITREYLNKIESGKMKPSKGTSGKLCIKNWQGSIQKH